MRATLNRIENYLTHTAVTMFLTLCALSLIKTETGTILATRNILFSLTGMGGLFLAAQLDDFRNMKLSQKRKRILRVVQTLLFAFSCILTIYALLELGLIARFNRWD